MLEDILQQVQDEREEFLQDSQKNFSDKLL
jgi:hypothetical protein